MKTLLVATGMLTLLLSSFAPSAEAVMRRDGSWSVQSYFQSQNSSQRPRWQRRFSPLRYRFSHDFVSRDFLRWRELETLPENSAEEEDDVPEMEFCNYESSIIGEYLPVTEVKNRCCTCDDGWKCEYSSVAGASTQYECSEDFSSSTD